MPLMSAKGYRRYKRGHKYSKRFSSSLTKKIKQVVNSQAEKKYIYSQETGTSVSNASPFHECISLMAEGDDYLNRTGLKCGIKKVEVNFYVTIAAAQSVTIPIRLMVYRAKGDEFGALPNLGEVFDNSQAVAQTTAAVLEPLALPGHESEYRKLFDKTVMLGPAVGNMTSRVIKFSKTFSSPLPLKWDLTSAAIGAITSGHLFVVAKSTDAAGAAAPVIHYMSRVTVVDY